jgi:mono/diheme cytochrome c family protein
MSPKRVAGMLLFSPPWRPVLKLPAMAVFSSVLVVSAALLPHGSVAASDAVAFTAPQATAGAKTYMQSCAKCHGANLAGFTGPALVGKSSAIAQQSLVEVYEYVSQQMPMSAPGSLSKAQYLSIVAYLLEKNGHTPGTHPLTESVATTGTAPIRSSP